MLDYSTGTRWCRKGHGVVSRCERIQDRIGRFFMAKDESLNRKGGVHTQPLSQLISFPAPPAPRYERHNFIP